MIAMIEVPIDGSSSLAPTLIATLGALVGVSVGSALTLYGQWKHRRYLHRERVRDAYARWGGAIDIITELEGSMVSRRVESESPRVRQFPHVMKRLDEDGHRLVWEISRANHRESALFGRLIMLDHGSAEIRLANEIRQLKPGLHAMKEAGDSAPSFERFIELEKTQAVKLGELSAQVCRRFGSAK